VTLFLLAHWPWLFAVAVVAVMGFVCHAAERWDRIWWWRRDHDRTMRKELEK